ncbi:MAG TPA: hypothetical protein PLU87_15035 [Sedimentisphaerales bacterium]|nr:hypothetical protein [Sedimentisphaerales bacterium]HRS12464.1 hypothetical protein [Sedimentisphaerales bacterium]HRV49093.1 hypothetical protein [Sedimentisphaerales bacterium]
MDEFTSALTIAAPFLVLLNCVLLYSVTQKARHSEKALARFEDRGRRKLERDTMEALTLLRTGKTEEARAVADRIVNV